MWYWLLIITIRKYLFGRSSTQRNVFPFNIFFTFYVYPPTTYEMEKSCIFRISFLNDTDIWIIQSGLKKSTGRYFSCPASIREGKGFKTTKKKTYFSCIVIFFYNHIKFLKIMLYLWWFYLILCSIAACQIWKKKKINFYLWNLTFYETWIGFHPSLSVNIITIWCANGLFNVG